LGELTALIQIPSCEKREGIGKGKKEGKEGEGRDIGKRRRMEERERE